MSLDLAFDFRQVIRGLRRRPAYVAAGAASLALVLAANATLFAAISATFFRPVPFRSGERTIALLTLPPGLHETKDQNPLHAADLVYFREHGRAIADVSGFTADDHVLTGSAEPVVTRMLSANASLFRLLADQPALGRAFTEDEEERHARVVVLTHGLWEQRFGGSPAAIGKTLDIDGEPYTVVGVMPPSFPPPVMASDLIVPLGITRSIHSNINPNRTYLLTVARIAGNATRADAAADTASMMREVVRNSPRTHLGWTSRVLSYREWQYGAFRAPLLALFAAMALLLIIAAANLASLALANVSSRRGEIALRRAIGASRGAIARLIVIEVGLLNLVGAAAGLLLAMGLLPAIVAAGHGATQSLGKITIDWRVAAYSFLSALVAAAAASLVPAMHASGGNLAAHGFGGNTRTHGSRAAGRWRSVLLVAQTALCLVLLVSGGLVLRALARSGGISPGFDAHNVLTAQMRLPPERYTTQQARTLVMEQIFERLNSVPGVIGASQTLNRFIAGQSFVTLLDIDGLPTADGTARTVQLRRISPGYFRTMRIRELRGRTFTAQDGTVSLPTAVISRGFAEQYFPGLDPIGRRVRRTDKMLTVVGVVDDVTDVSLVQTPEPTLYLPWSQSNTAVSPVSLVIRTAGDPLQMVSAVRAAVLSVDPKLPIDRLLLLDDFLADSLAPQRFRATLLMVLGAIGLILGAVGVAGVTARSIAERMSEFGVRLALGCDAGALWRHAIGGQLRFVAAGAVLGLLLSMGAGKLMGYLLPEIGAVDPLAMMAAAVALLVTCAVASGIPALRVLRLDPVEVLRN